jgi:N-acetylglucosamine kinase-like BadF-type ATPase
VRASWTDQVAEGAGFVHVPGRVDAMVNALEPALRALGADRPIDALAMGHTGLPADGADRAEIAALLARRTGARRVLVAPDWVTAHMGAFGGEPGVVLAAGTGAVALGVDASGVSRKADGNGYLFGDAGSGFAIGRAALASALAHAEGRVESAGLAEAAQRRYGTDVHSAAWALYAGRAVVDSVAQFAPDVIALAGAGDPVAVAIVESAAHELAATTAAAASVLAGPRVAVAVTGRLLAADNHLARRFTSALSAAEPRSDLRPARGGSLDGAVTLAQSGPGIHASLVHIYQEST